MLINEHDKFSLFERIAKIENEISHITKSLDEIKFDVNKMHVLRSDIERLMEDHSERKKQWMWLKRGFIGAIITSVWSIYDKFRG